MEIQTRGKDDFELNGVLRAGMRAKRKAAAAEVADGKKIGLSIPLLAPAPEDAKAAAGVAFTQDRRHRYDVAERVKRAEICSQSIFAQPSASTTKAVVLAASERRVGSATLSTPSASPSSASAAVKKVKLGITPALAVENDKGKIVAAVGTVSMGPPRVASAPKVAVKLIPKLKVVAGAGAAAPALPPPPLV